MDERSSINKSLFGSRLSIVVGIVMAVLGAASANANVTYLYTGPNFTTAFSPYTTSDNVTASITLSAEPGPTFSPIIPIDFSFSDGVQTITNLTPNVAIVNFSFSADASGTITQWNAFVNVTPAPGIVDAIQTVGTPPVLFFFDQAQHVAGTVISNASTNINEVPGTVAGHWTLQSASAVPEPSTWAMMLIGFAGIGFAFRKSRREGSFA
jgi:PEP-CTERM motif